MFTEALNAPWLLIVLYAIPLCSSFAQIAYWFAWFRKGSELSWLVFGFVLLGAGLALLGAAYLHDVWYC